MSFSDYRSNNIKCEELTKKLSYKGLALWKKTSQVHPFWMWCKKYPSVLNKLSEEFKTHEILTTRMLHFLDKLAEIDKEVKKAKSFSEKEEKKRKFKKKGNQTNDFVYSILSSGGKSIVLLEKERISLKNEMKKTSLIIEEQKEKQKKIKKLMKKEKKKKRKEERKKKYQEKNESYDKIDWSIPIHIKWERMLKSGFSFYSK